MKLKFSLTGKIYLHNLSKKFIQIACFYLILLASSQAVFSNQEIVLKGKIIDIETQKPISGVSISVKNTNYGTYSDKEGVFYLKIQAEPNQYIFHFQFSHILYQSNKLIIGKENSNIIEVQLKPKIFQVPDVIVSANKRSQSIQEVSNSVMIIDKNQIQLSSSFDLEKSLQNIPGIEVNDETISIRGSDGFDFGLGSRSLLLVNGLPLMSGDNGDAKLNLIPPTLINNIEIVKGAGSALYGSNAIGGIININTNFDGNAQGSQFRIITDFGLYTDPKYKQWKLPDAPHTESKIGVNYTFSNSKLLAAINATISQDESYRMYDDAKDYGVFSQFSYKFNKSTINAILLHESTDRADWVYWNSLDSATLPPTDTDLDTRIFSNKSMLGLNYDYFLNKNIFLNLKSSVLFTQFWNNLEQTDTDYRSSDAISSTIDLQSNINIFANLLLTSGINFTNNSVSSFSYGKRNQLISAFYSQFEFKPIKSIITTFGGRFDYELSENKSGATTFSPKFGLTYLPNNDLRIRLSLGKGFRAPSIAERFASISFQGFDVIENPKLTFEESMSYESGITYQNIQLIPFELELSGFYTRYWNLIEPSFVNQSYTTIQFINLVDAEISGLEGNFKLLILPILPLSVSYTYLNPIDLSDNKILKFRSRNHINTNISFLSNNFSAGISFRYSSKVERIDDALVVQVKDALERVDMKVLDFNINLKYNNLYTVKDEIIFKLNVYNLLDYYYTYMVGNLAPTRLISFGIDYQF